MRCRSPDYRIDLLPASMLIPIPLWLRALPPSPGPRCPECGALPYHMGTLGMSWEWSCSACGERYWSPRLGGPME